MCDLPVVSAEATQPVHASVLVHSTTDSASRVISKLQNVNVGILGWRNSLEHWSETSKHDLTCGMVLVVLPSYIEPPVSVFWNALTALVKAAQKTGCEVSVTAKHPRTAGGFWKHQAFRSWRKQFPMTHARVCFCGYGVPYCRRPYHFELNVLSLTTPVSYTHLTLPTILLV